MKLRWWCRQCWRETWACEHQWFGYDLAYVMTFGALAAALIALLAYAIWLATWT